MQKVPEIHIANYNYYLPDERIAKYPLAKRDSSKLLVYRKGSISVSHFDRLPRFLPMKSLLVFNNTRVIQARLLFTKTTGAQIEIFCLEPAEPADYALNFQQNGQCSWYCLIGNLKKWKEGILQKTVQIKNDFIEFSAERKDKKNDTFLITFSWNHEAYTFADILETAGQLPIPPYLHRATEQSDLQAYQTIYAKIKGSVAAPTAGLHFTPDVLAALRAKEIGLEEITLHVGAGTFRPVQTETIEQHTMHTEYFTVHRNTIQRLLDNLGHIIAVGTTSVRTLESLYYLGAALIEHPDAIIEQLVIKQWIFYETQLNNVSPSESLLQILKYMDKRHIDSLVSTTQIMIAPGYIFKMIQGMITNFHQPQSTLLLLVSAFVEGNWRKIYEYALMHDFRFLSYGDCSLLINS